MNKAPRLKAYGQFGSVHFEAEPDGDVVRINDLPPEVREKYIEPPPPRRDPREDDEDDDA